MGLLSWLGFGGLPGDPVASRGVVSPWAGPAQLSRIVLEDLYGLKSTTITRSEAMSVPGVTKARHLICETLARQPLRAYKDGVELPVQPTWLYRTDTQIPPRLRTLWMLDDLLFYDWSLLKVRRGAERQILDAERVPIGRWRFDDGGQVLVDDKGVPAEEYLVIPGLGDGLLAYAARTIRAARNLEDQWTARVKNPVPVTEIRYTGDEVLEPEEMTDIRDQYIAARDDVNGTVMVTPAGFEVHPHGDQALDLFVAGRNAASIDLARFTNIPAVMLDASNVNASSVNYTNQAVGRSEFVDLCLRSWALPLEERLSMDDATVQGTYINFDLSGLRLPDVGTGPTLED